MQLGVIQTGCAQQAKAEGLKANNPGLDPARTPAARPGAPGSAGAGTVPPSTEGHGAGTAAYRPAANLDTLQRDVELV